MMNQNKLNEIRERQQLRQANLILEKAPRFHTIFSPRIVLILKQSRNFRLNNKPQPEAGTQAQGFQLSASI